MSPLLSRVQFFKIHVNIECFVAVAKFDRQFVKPIVLDIPENFDLALDAGVA